jgi:hypothetical protein
MAKITFSLDELIGVLAANAFLPKDIVRARAKSRSLHFAIKTGLPLLPFVPASLNFSNFDGNIALFDLSIVSGRLDKVLNRFDELLKSKLPACIQIDYPRLRIDVNKVLADKGLKGIRVKDMFFEDDDFVVLTDSA